MPIVKQCPSYFGYSVSECGVVYSHWRRVYGIKGRGSRVVFDAEYKRVKSCTPNKRSGYIMVNLTIDGKERYVGLHSMLLDAFVGPCPEGMQCRHLDGDKTNNRLVNLAWGTCLENAQDRKLHGHYSVGKDHHNSKLSDDAIIDIRHHPKYYGYVQDLAQKYKVSPHTIRTVLSGRSWRHVK